MTGHRALSSFFFFFYCFLTTCLCFCHSTCEPRHDKTNKMSVRQAKTQISLGIHSVWSESSLSAWRKLGSLATHWAHSEDWSDGADAAHVRVGVVIHFCVGVFLSSMVIAHKGKLVALLAVFVCYLFFLVSRYTTRSMAAIWIVALPWDLHIVYFLVFISLTISFRDFRYSFSAKETLLVYTTTRSLNILIFQWLLPFPNLCSSFFH